MKKVKVNNSLLDLKDATALKFGDIISSRFISMHHRENDTMETPNGHRNRFVISDNIDLNNGTVETITEEEFEILSQHDAVDEPSLFDEDTNQTEIMMRKEGKINKDKQDSLRKVINDFKNGILPIGNLTSSSSQGDNQNDSIEWLHSNHNLLIENFKYNVANIQYNITYDNYDYLGGTFILDDVEFHFSFDFVDEHFVFGLDDERVSVYILENELELTYNDLDVDEEILNLIIDEFEVCLYNYEESIANRNII